VWLSNFAWVEWVFPLSLGNSLIPFPLLFIYKFKYGVKHNLKSFQKISVSNYSRKNPHHKLTGVSIIFRNDFHFSTIQSKRIFPNRKSADRVVMWEKKWWFFNWRIIGSRLGVGNRLRQQLLGYFKMHQFSISYTCLIYSTVYYQTI
jgi:hypothetical protein